jgi:hypothetical protein
MIDDVDNALANYIGTCQAKAAAAERDAAFIRRPTGSPGLDAANERRAQEADKIAQRWRVREQYATQGKMCRHSFDLEGRHNLREFSALHNLAAANWRFVEMTDDNQPLVH